MSENYRKDVDVYSEHCMPEMDGKTKRVYRPNSMRQVSAVKELNRLRDALREIREEACHVDCNCPSTCLKCTVIGVIK